MVGEQEVEVERQRGDEVDDVDGRADERQLARTHDEPDEDLEREPGVADALDVEEGVVRVGASLVEHPLRRRRRRRRVRPDDRRRRRGRGRCRRRRRRRGRAGGRGGAVGQPRERHVLDRRNSHARMSLDAERKDRDDDEEHRHRSDRLHRRNTRHAPTRGLLDRIACSTS